MGECECVYEWNFFFFGKGGGVEGLTFDLLGVFSTGV